MIILFRYTDHVVLLVCLFIGGSYEHGMNMSRSDRKVELGIYLYMATLKYIINGNVAMKYCAAYVNITQPIIELLLF